MKMTSRSTLAWVLLAAASACSQPAPDDEGAPEANDVSATGNSPVADPGNVAPTPAPTAPASAEARPKAPAEPKIKIAPVPKAEKPKAPPPPVDPHAGHDMNKM